MKKILQNRYLLASLVLLIVVGAVVAVHRRRASEAEAALRAFCADHGGYLSRDLVDGTYWVHLENTHLTHTDMQLLRSNGTQLASRDLGGPGAVHVYLSHSTFEGDFVEILNKSVVGLTLSGLPVNDATASKIVERSPRLRTLVLDGTAITDRSISVLKRLPLGMLDVRNTSITLAGLRHLADHPHLYCLYISRAHFSVQEVDELRRSLGCDILEK